MGDLLEAAIEAHGGLARWNELNEVSARLIQDGVLWALKGQAGVLDDVVVAASLHEERASHRPFGAADRHGAFTPNESRSRPTTEPSSRRLTTRAPRSPDTRPRPRGAPFSSRTSRAMRCGRT
jgi:hypothetical protein